MNRTSLIISACTVMAITLAVVPIPIYFTDIIFALINLFTIYILICTLVPGLFATTRGNIPSLSIVLAIMRVNVNVAYARALLEAAFDGSSIDNGIIADLSRVLTNGRLITTFSLYAFVLSVNVILLNKGLTRVTEVLARFSLDSLPGRQIGIDAEVSSGAIDQRTSAQKKKDLQAESAFYAAMDGAGKFLRGEAICNVIITTIEITSLSIVSWQTRGDGVPPSAATAFSQAFFIGLSLQLMTVAASSAASFAVSRSFHEGPGDSNVAPMLPARYRCALGCIISVLVAPLLPSIAKALPFALSLLYTLYMPRRFQGTSVFNHSTASPIANETDTLDAIRVEVGRALLPLVSFNSRTIAHRLDRHRRAIAREMGVRFPLIRFQDNPSLPSDSYLVKLRDVVVAKGALRPELCLAINATNEVVPIVGRPAEDPVFGLPAMWIDPEKTSDATKSNWIVVDNISLLVAHLVEVIKENLGEILTLPYTHLLLQSNEEHISGLVANIIPAQLPIIVVHRVLQLLLFENVSIRDLPVILESVQEACSGNSRHAHTILAHVRQRLNRQLTAACHRKDEKILAIALSSQQRDRMASALGGTQECPVFELREEYAAEFLQHIKGTLEAWRAPQADPILIVEQSVRPYIYRLLRRAGVSIQVLSHAEVNEDVCVEIAAVV